MRPFFLFFLISRHVILKSIVGLAGSFLVFVMHLTQSSGADPVVCRAAKIAQEADVLGGVSPRWCALRRGCRLLQPKSEGGE